MIKKVSYTSKNMEEIANILADKIDELVDAFNEHKKWHERFWTGFKNENPFDSPTNKTSFNPQNTTLGVDCDEEAVEHDETALPEVSYAPEGYVSAEEVANEIFHTPVGPDRTSKQMMTEVLSNYTIVRKQ